MSDVAGGSYNIERNLAGSTRSCECLDPVGCSYETAGEDHAGRVTAAGSLEAEILTTCGVSEKIVSLNDKNTAYYLCDIEGFLGRRG